MMETYTITSDIPKLRLPKLIGLKEEIESARIIRDGVLNIPFSDVCNWFVNTYCKKPLLFRESVDRKLWAVFKKNKINTKEKAQKLLQKWFVETVRSHKEAFFWIENSKYKKDCCILNEILDNLGRQ